MNSRPLLISPTFQRDATHNSQAPDTLLRSEPGQMLFYLHKAMLLSRSSNRFASLIPLPVIAKPFTVPHGGPSCTSLKLGLDTNTGLPTPDATPLNSPDADSSIGDEYPGLNLSRSTDASHDASPLAPMNEAYTPSVANPGSMGEGMVHKSSLGPVGRQELAATGRIMWPDGQQLIDHNRDSSLLWISVPHSPEVLTIVLHLIYGLPTHHFMPTLTTLSHLLSAMIHFGLDPLQYTQSLAFYCHAHISESPLHVYTLAARYNLEAIAVAASPATLSIPLENMDRDLVPLMGGPYLHRLICLRAHRLSAIKAILIAPPSPAPSASGSPAAVCKCAEEQLLRFQRSWSLAVASLVWSGKCLGDLSGRSVVDTLGPLTPLLDCLVCRAQMERRIVEILADWEKLPSTI